VEYRDFQYSNEYGGLDLQRGSMVGTALSWLVIKALYITLSVICLGLGIATWKYFTADIVPPATAAPFSPQAVATPLPTIDYSLHPLRGGLTASPAAVLGALHSSAAPAVQHLRTGQAGRHRIATPPVR
jgi:hypothetical protein